MTADDSDMAQNDNEQEPVVVRDRRRIDPVTGQLRNPVNGDDPVADEQQAKPEAQQGEPAPETGAEAPAEQPAAGSEAQAELQKRVDELTEDLKRVTAEYANYRKRVERDREAMVLSAKASLAGELLMVLDDLERAEAHGDLTGAFKAVADKLVNTLNSAGLEAFGEEGDEFDPSVHEAVQHSTSPEVSGPTVTAVLRRGYRFGDRVLRPAMVAVTDHEPAGSAEQEQSGAAEQEQARAADESAEQD